MVGIAHQDDIADLPLGTLHWRQISAKRVDVNRVDGAASTGSATDGHYAGGTYAPGVEAASFTVESVVTQIGARRRW